MSPALLFPLFYAAMAPQNDGALPKFDVVSVVVDHAGTGGAGDKLPRHGTWRWTRIPLSFLIMYAYDVSLKQIDNIPGAFQGPDPAFDITAKMPPNVSNADFRLMLQSMLADRFKFAAHREMRELPVVTIEVTKGGPKLTPASGQCVPPDQSATLPEGQYRCGDVQLSYPYEDGVRRQKWFGRSVSIGDLAAALSPNGPVVDDTGIQGRYDLDVAFDSPLAPASDDPGERLAHEADYQRTFRAAFEKQVGLSIDLGKAKKRPIPVIVVDRVELPSAN